jgi:hypothetical protein
MGWLALGSYCGVVPMNWVERTFMISIASGFLVFAMLAALLSTL